MISSLDQLLKNLGLPVGPSDGAGVEGYMTECQRVQFCEKLQEYAPIQSILEIGLNVGHSAENFLESCPNLQRFVSFDLCFHKYTDFAVKYLEEKYGNRFQFVKGDSRQTIGEYAVTNANKPFDLIYIDGNHQYEYCLADIGNCAKLARAGSKVWIDDYNSHAVFLAVHKQEYNGLIQILNVYESHDPNGGFRSWVEAKYL